VFFKDVKIPERDRIGPENEGWRIARDMMIFERSGIGQFAEGKKTLEQIIEYTKTTKRGGKFLSENPIVRQKIAKLFIDLEVGNNLAYKIGWLHEQGDLKLVTPLASESKIFGTELMQRIAIFGTEIMGLYGQLETSKWAPLDGHLIDTYQTSIGTNIAGGSNEIQRNMIAWTGLGLPRFK